MEGSLLQSSGEAVRVERPWVLLEVTRRCELRCTYCYATAFRYDDELTPERLERILDRIMAHVVPLGITLIGGEPLLLLQLEELIRCIHGRKIVTSVSTKGSGLDEQRILQLRRAGLSAIELSVDALDPALYERLTGRNMPRIQAILASLVRSGMLVNVGVMLTRVNLDQIEPLLELCFALGVQRVSLNQMATVGSGSDHRTLALDDTELTLTLRRANARASALGLTVAVGLPLEPCRLAHDRFPALRFEACGCGDRKWVIEPSGNVRTCELAPLPIGNLLLMSWRDLVESDAATRFLEQGRQGACKTCGDWQSCRGGCRYRCQGSTGALGP